MRRAADLRASQIIRDAASTFSACSTSGRHAGERALDIVRCLSSKPNPKKLSRRADFYDPNRDVYKEFAHKWAKANTDAAAADAAELAGQPSPHLAPTADDNPLDSWPPVSAHKDWPPGYEHLLRSFLQQELSLTEAEANGMVEAALEGRLQASRDLIRTRFMQIRDLEPRFPGFHARSAVLQEPRLLRHSVTKLFQAMLVFQDQWSAHPVGPLMARIGSLIARDPIGLGTRLHALSRAFAQDVGLVFDPHRLSADSAAAFLYCNPYELEARVSATVTIFGPDGAKRLLAQEYGILRHAPQGLNTAVRTLREVFSARGYGMYGKHHVGTAEGLAAAAMDRAYVTELVLAYPGVLGLAEEMGQEELGQLFRWIEAADGVRYGREVGRDALLQYMLAQPKALQQAAVAAQKAQKQDAEPDEVVAAVAAVVQPLLGPGQSVGQKAVGSEEAGEA